ncbi:MAG: energy transducer TonB [Bacteroidetes bacterium]|nr:energy transducer TonB [Bacteroidota bacterium]
MYFNVSTQTFVLALALGTTLVFFSILLFRFHLKNTTDNILSKKHTKKENSSPLKERNKHSNVDVFKMRGTLLKIGLATALLLVVLAFSWTTYDQKIERTEYSVNMGDVIEMEPPRIIDFPKPLPLAPLPPQQIEEVPKDEIIENVEDFEDGSIDAEDAVIIPPPVMKKEVIVPHVNKPILIQPEEKVPPIFKVVEEMPRFPGCEDSGGTMKEKKECADNKLLEFIYRNIKYPAIARENGVEGIVVIQFVIDKDGSISNARIVRDIGAQCGQEALRVVEFMNTEELKWTPGKQRSQAVRVQFNLPVKFRLAKD